SHAPAQNGASQILLALSEDERNAVFTHLLHGSNERCDWVIRTLFNGTALGLDNWEVLCRDRNSYSLSIPPEVNADVELVSCRELITTSKRILRRAGRKIKGTGCRIKGNDLCPRQHGADRLSIPLGAAWRADASQCSLDPPSPHKPLSCLARNLFDRALPGARRRSGFVGDWRRWRSVRSLDGPLDPSLGRRWLGLTASLALY